MVVMAGRRRRAHLGAPRWIAARKLRFRIMIGLFVLGKGTIGIRRTGRASTRVHATADEETSKSVIYTHHCGKFEKYQGRGSRAALTWIKLHVTIA